VPKAVKDDLEHTFLLLGIDDRDDCDAADHPPHVVEARVGTHDARLLGTLDERSAGAQEQRAAGAQRVRFGRGLEQRLR